MTMKYPRERKTPATAKCALPARQKKEPRGNAPARLFAKKEENHSSAAGAAAGASGAGMSASSMSKISVAPGGIMPAARSP